jgi:hypothetical protein
MKNLWFSLFLSIIGFHWAALELLYNGFAKSWFVTSIIGLFIYGLCKMLQVLPFNDKKARRLVGRTG